MNEIIINRNPGYVYDLFFIFYTKFNSELFIANAGIDLASDVREDINKYAELFGTIPEELYLFFHTEDAGNAFLNKYYFMEYYKRPDFSFRFLMNKLQDKKLLKYNMIKHYLSPVNEAEAEKFMTEDFLVFERIKESYFTYEEKTRLYEFFINPDYYLNMLLYEFSKKEIALSDYYTKYYHKATACAEKITRETISSIFSIEEEANITLSFCLLNRFLFYSDVCQYDCTFMFGVDYESALDYSIDEHTNADLTTLGDLLSEKNRVEILRFIAERGEIVRKELEAEFSFSGSTAYHHLATMQKAGAVLVRTNGKVMKYKLNAKYFDMAIELLTPFSSENSSNICGGGKKCHKKGFQNSRI